MIKKDIDRALKDYDNDFAIIDSKEMLDIAVKLMGFEDYEDFAEKVEDCWPKVAGWYFHIGKEQEVMQLLAFWGIDNDVQDKIIALPRVAKEDLDLSAHVLYICMNNLYAEDVIPYCKEYVS